MTSRRGDQRMWRRNPSGVYVPGPLEIIKSVPIAFYYDSGDVTQSGGAVSSWTDLSGNGRHAVQATGSKRPAYNASDSAFGGAPSLTFDGVDDELVTTVTVPAPGAQPCWYWFVFRTITWVAARRLFGAPVTTHLVYQNLNTPEYSLYNGGAVGANNGAPVGQVRRGEAYFSGSAADYLIIGSKMTGLAFSGNLGPAATFSIGAENGASFCNVALSSLLRTDGQPTAAEKLAMSAFAARKFSAGI